MTPLPRVPGIAYVMSFAAVLLLGASWSLYRHGVHTGERGAHRTALRDSVVQTRAVVEKAAAATERVAKVADKARAASDTGRAKLAPIRALAVPLLDSTPAPVVHYVTALEQQVARDSVTQLVQAAALDTARAEIREHVKLDTLQQHTIDLGPETHTGRTLVMGGVLGAAAVLALVHFVR